MVTSSLPSWSCCCWEDGLSLLAHYSGDFSPCFFANFVCDVKAQWLSAVWVWSCLHSLLVNEESSVYQFQYVLVIVMLCWYWRKSIPLTNKSELVKCPPLPLQLGFTLGNLEVLWSKKWGSLHFCRGKQQEESQKSESEEARLQGCICTAGELTWMLVGKIEGTVNQPSWK